MKRLTLLVTLLSIMAGFVLSGVSDADTSSADTSIPDDEVSCSIGETVDSASATITMPTAPMPDE